MVTKLTITIPDDLAERLEPWRDRMNLSKICAEAIAREVALLADLPAEVQEFTDLVGRLRVERADSRQRDRQTGFDAGVRYAQNRLSYDEFALLEQIVEDAKAGRRSSAIDVIVGSEELEDVVTDVAEEMRDAGITDANLYWDGWLAGVLSVWEVVRAKV